MYVHYYNIKYIKVKLTLLSGIKCTAKIYHTVGTVPKSNRKIVEKATSIPITHIYMTCQLAIGKFLEY
jgi:hypothetical protein